MAWVSRAPFGHFGVDFRHEPCCDLRLLAEVRGQVRKQSVDGFLGSRIERWFAEFENVRCEFLDGTEERDCWWLFGEFVGGGTEFSGAVLQDVEDVPDGVICERRIGASVRCWCRELGVGHGCFPSGVGERSPSGFEVEVRYLRPRGNRSVCLEGKCYRLPFSSARRRTVARMSPVRREWNPTVATPNVVNGEFRGGIPRSRWRNDPASWIHHAKL